MDFRKFMGWAMAATLVLGLPALTAALEGTGDTGLQERQGVRMAATGSSGTSPDSTTQTGRGSSGGGMGTSGGTQDIDSDTMKRGMTFQSTTGATGMSNMTGMMAPGMMHQGGGESGY